MEIAEGFDRPVSARPVCLSVMARRRVHFAASTSIRSFRKLDWSEGASSRYVLIPTHFESKGQRAYATFARPRRRVHGVPKTSLCPIEPEQGFFSFAKLHGMLQTPEEQTRRGHSRARRTVRGKARPRDPFIDFARSRSRTMPGSASRPQNRADRQENIWIREVLLPMRIRFFPLSEWKDSHAPRLRPPEAKARPSPAGTGKWRILALRLIRCPKIQEFKAS